MKNNLVCLPVQRTPTIASCLHCRYRTDVWSRTEFNFIWACSAYGGRPTVEVNGKSDCRRFSPLPVPVPEPGLSWRTKAGILAAVAGALVACLAWLYG